jgi:hypothetical protein
VNKSEREDRLCAEIHSYLTQFGATIFSAALSALSNVDSSRSSKNFGHVKSVLCLAKPLEGPAGV